MNSERSQMGFTRNYSQKQQYSAEEAYQKNNVIPLNQRWSSRYQDQPTNYNTFNLNPSEKFWCKQSISASLSWIPSAQ